MTVISNLIRDGIIEELPNHQFQCGCGSIISAGSVYKHIKTIRHTVYVHSDKNDNIKELQCATEECSIAEECSICYSDKSDYFECPQCHNKHCMDCNEQVDKCPFCRLVIKYQIVDDELPIGNPGLFRNNMPSFMMAPDGELYSFRIDGEFYTRIVYSDVFSDVFIMRDI